MNLTKYVDPFIGTENCPTDFEQNLCKKWFFLKAQIGNTHPGAALPFSMVSACAYSGAYPTGYGVFAPNSHGVPDKYIDRLKICGFTHMQQSGTGAIDKYYNFVRLIPGNTVDTNISKLLNVAGEKAHPGYYCVTIPQRGVKCELSVSEGAAIHRYTFSDGKGYVFADLAQSGLSNEFPDKFQVPLTVNGAKIVNNNAVAAQLEFDGVKMYTCVLPAATARVSLHGTTARFDFNTSVCECAVGFSLVSADKAFERASAVLHTGFDETVNKAVELWEEKLGKISVSGADKKVFYTAMYHSMLKPASLCGDKLLGEVECVDFSTLWDMYKTQLPLVFTLDKEMSQKIVSSLLSAKQAFGKMPICMTLSSKTTCDSQARMLAGTAVCDAINRGIPLDDLDGIYDTLLDDFNVSGGKALAQSCIAQYPTHALDCCEFSTTLCNLGKRLGKQCDELEALGKNISKLFNVRTGYLTQRGLFYEGCYRNYSFRLMHDMNARIKLTGNTANFERQLDDLFGFYNEDAVQIGDPRDAAAHRKGSALMRFEGFNNESDMEAPYCYLYLGRPDRTYALVRAGMTELFTAKRSGLPGNDDSGALSSMYIWSSLGVFPVAGTDKMLLSTPLVSKAKLSLQNGNTMRIIKNTALTPDRCAKRIRFNGEEITERYITVEQFMGGGKLEFLP